jgi:recombination protein RecA
MSDQMKDYAQKKEESKSKEVMISTGSTLLDLAISGEVCRGGGLPGGLLVEIFGPSGCGKTVLLCEIAGSVQRQGGEVKFFDPEARLNKRFARLFDLDTNVMTYDTPDTVTEVFAPVRKWAPLGQGVNGIFADSLAALSTDMEMDDQDKMGMRRAKEFSQQLRQTCRIIKQKNFLMVCSNQVRINVNAGPYEQKYLTPGGVSIGFYASIRLRCSNPQKLKREKTLPNGKTVSRVIGVETDIDVYKNTAGKPYRTATVPIIYDYGIDDIRQNLQFIKDCTKTKQYMVQDRTLSNSLEKSCQLIETNKLEHKLREHVIDLWEEVEARFVQERKPKRG